MFGLLLKNKLCSLKPVSIIVVWRLGVYRRREKMPPEDVGFFTRRL